MFLNKNKAFVLGLVLIWLLAISTPAQAFTETTTAYIALSTFPQDYCRTQFIEGISDPYNPNEILKNPDYISTNRQCLGLDNNCMAKQYAEKYRAFTRDEMQECKKEKTKATMAYFYINAYDPSNWKKVEEACKIQFNHEVEEVIKERRLEFSVMRTCPTDTNETANLRFNNGDLNTIITNLTDFWKQEEVQDKDVEIAKATAEKMIDTIRNQLDEEPTDKEIEIATEMILDMSKYKCMISEQEETNLYHEWKLLTPIAQSCLRNFLTGSPTMYWEFTGQCSGFGATQDPLQYTAASYQAYFSLDQYFAAGFATRQCEQQRNQFDPTNQSTFPICQYTPKNLAGCVQGFENRQEDEQAIQDNAVVWAFAWIIGLAIFLVIVFALFLRKGV